jgi:hypothetical protein
LQTHSGELDGIAHLVVQRDRLLQSHDQARLIVILQIAPDFRGISDDGNAQSAQQRGRANARQLQQLRRLQCAG